MVNIRHRNISKDIPNRNEAMKRHLDFILNLFSMSSPTHLIQSSMRVSFSLCKKERTQMASERKRPIKDEESSLRKGRDREEGERCTQSSPSQKSRQG